MIIRIVKMSFQPEKLHEFMVVFNASKEKIRAFEGCQHLSLLENKEAKNVLFTYSYWENEECLEKYRHSELFKSTWAKTKVLFNEKPEAWSLNNLTSLI